MQTQAQISFDDIPIDEAVRDEALEHIDQLENHVRRRQGTEKMHHGSIRESLAGRTPLNKEEDWGSEQQREHE